MSVRVNGSNIDRAYAAWGAEMPEEIRTLADACDATSQGRVAELIGRSKGLISRVIARKYPGDLADVFERVRAVLDAETVACPAIGDAIPLTACRRNRSTVNRGGAARNHLQQLFRRHCPSCPHNPEGDRP